MHGGAIKFYGRIDGTRSLFLRLVITNASSKSTKVFLDNKLMGRFQQKFDTMLSGGIFMYNSGGDSGDSYKNVGLFRNFELSGCMHISPTGVCKSGKINQMCISLDVIISME